MDVSVSSAYPNSQALPTDIVVGHSQAMLDDTPEARKHVASKTGERLREAITEAIKEEVTTLEEIAAECINPVTKQKKISSKAIYGWYNTGRISKENLLTVERLTEYSWRYIAFGELPKKTNELGATGLPSGSPRAQALATLYDAHGPEEKRQLWPRLLRLLTKKQRGSDEVRQNVAEGLLNVLDEMGPATLAGVLSDHAIQLEKQAKQKTSGKPGKTGKHRS